MSTFGPASPSDSSSDSCKLVSNRMICVRSLSHIFTVIVGCLIFAGTRFASTVF